MFAIASPPHYAQRIRSDDPDEVSSWAERRDGDHSRVVHGTGPYGFQAAFLEGQSVWLGWARTRLGQTIRARAQQPMVQFPIDGTQHYAFGRRRVGVAPGTLAFCGPGTEMSRHSGAGMVFAMDVDGAALTAEVSGRRPGTSLAWPQFPQALTVSAASWRAMTESIAELVWALDPETSSAQRMHCEGQVIAALSDALMSPSSTNRAGQLAVQRLADLEDWIDAHLGEAITLGRLCRAAQIGDRSLQLAFNARRGMSPMRFVCEQRLAVAHRLISRTEVCDQITAIATSLGFTHLGRFSVAYRKAFGESPSQTWLRNRKSSARPVPGTMVRR
jgi:AraC-like DNA-binding protein